jgi:hypothetical protein
MKTIENPTMNMAQFAAIRFRNLERLSAFCISSNDTPEINDMYPGTMGRTHGETNESKPNANAVTRLTLSKFLSHSFELSHIIKIRFFYPRIKRSTFPIYGDPSGE